MARILYHQKKLSIFQLFDIAKSESIPPAEIPDINKQKLEEKQKLEKQIQEADALLHSKNVDIETIIEFIKLRATE